MAPEPSKSGHTAGDLVVDSQASTEEPTPYPFNRLSLPPCLSMETQRRKVRERLSHALISCHIREWFT